MRTNFSRIYLILIVLLVFQTAFGQTESSDKTNEGVSAQQVDWRIENLMKQAHELFEAYDNADYAKYVEMSHPKVYEKDGAAKFYGEVEYVISSRRSKGEEIALHRGPAHRRRSPRRCCPARSPAARA